MNDIPKTLTTEDTSKGPESERTKQVTVAGWTAGITAVCALGYPFPCTCMAGGFWSGDRLGDGSVRVLVHLKAVREYMPPNKKRNVNTVERLVRSCNCGQTHLAINKLKTSIIGILFAASAATLIIAQHQAKIKLQEENRGLLAQHEQVSGLAEESPSGLVAGAQTARRETELGESSRELLRLRGEVARLRQSQDQLEKLRAETEKLRQEIRLLRGPSLREMYGFDGLDTNSIPEIELGTAKEDVLAELRRVEARVLSDEDTFVHAEIFPMDAAGTSTSLARIAMEFYFQGGKLTSRKDSQKWQ
jgi:cell division protein FtsB